MSPTAPVRPLVHLPALVLAAAGVLAAISCSGERPSPGAAPGASASDLAAISRIHRDYVAAHNEADPDKMMALWMDDAVLMPMDEPALAGTQAIRGHYEEFFDQNPSEITLSPIETRIAGDWAFERLQVTVTMAGGEGEIREARVKYLWILQKDKDGAWKIARAIYNLDGSIEEEGDVSA